jgi:hypothetical protein
MNDAFVALYDQLWIILGLSIEVRARDLRELQLRAWMLSSSQKLFGLRDTHTASLAEALAADIRHLNAAQEQARHG